MARVGSFAASVDLPEQLRPWALSGLDALFLPGGLPACPQPTPMSSGDAPADAPASPASLSAPAGIAWPEPWARLASRVRAQPKVIITYASLAADVTGAADPGRRALFQKVLAYLAWPQGTTLFWPVMVDQTPQELGFFATDVFAQGVQHFGVAHIAAFGETVARRCVTLYPQEGAKPEIAVHGLPSPEELAAMLPHLWQIALAPLKALPF